MSLGSITVVWGGPAWGRGTRESGVLWWGSLPEGGHLGWVHRDAEIWVGRKKAFTGRHGF